MKHHTKIYFDFFGYTPGEFIPCEICGNTAVDIHHINARGMGGNPSGDKDNIQNLQALCRKCHIEYGDISELKDILQQVHNKFIEVYGR